MNAIAGVIGGVIGGLIGAAVWAGISYGTGYEIGWIAWGVGGLVGMGSIMAARGGNAFMGGVAVVITILALLVGKYAALQLSIFKDKSNVMEESLASLQGDELVVSYMADEIIADIGSSGETVEWPEGVDPNEASKQSDYPPGVWTEATSRWEQMADADRQAYRDDIGERMRRNIDAFYAVISNEGFLASFGAMDLVFFGLAIVTAYKMAATGPESAAQSDDGEEAAEGEDEIG